MEISYSEDGKDFTLIATIANQTLETQDGTFTESFVAEFQAEKARYIKVVAKNKGQCPSWHPGAGNPAWIFCDEVIVW